MKEEMKRYNKVEDNVFVGFQALQLGQDASPPYGIFNGQRCHMCLRSDSLVKVMERLANPGTHYLLYTIFSFVA